MTAKRTEKILQECRLEPIRVTVQSKA